MTNEEKRKMYTALAAPFPEHCIFDLQPTGHKLAARQAGTGGVGLRLQVVTKAKVPVVQRLPVPGSMRTAGIFVKTISVSTEAKTGCGEPPGKCGAYSNTLGTVRITSVDTAPAGESKRDSPHPPIDPDAGGDK